MDNVMCILGSSSRLPKMEIVPCGLAILGNVCSLLMMMEPIPYMYRHISTMLECKECDWFLSECNMSCSLLTTVRSNK